MSTVARSGTEGVPAQAAAPAAGYVTPLGHAWSAYQAHRGDCSQCTNSVWRCPDGNELWNAVTGA
jgi:hypothetical protein